MFNREKLPKKYSKETEGNKLASNRGIEFSREYPERFVSKRIYTV
jgi:hypothetical protein